VAGPGERVTDARLVRRAQDGEERAFVELTAAHRGALHAHCYRMLGSIFDADDALQETMLRAWRGIDGYAPESPIAGWLYRIATNVSLRMLEQRARRPEPVDAHLEPYTPGEGGGPEASAETREAIGLAYVAAMQLLPPKQRAVLLLRDVLDWSSREAADALGDSVAAVNSALQRARKRLARERDEGTLAREHRPADAGVERDLMLRFQAAWDAVDIPELVALLADDALLTMPPEGVRIAEATAIGEFFATAPLDGRMDRIRLEPADANGQPALAAYADEHGVGDHRAYGVMVFAIDGDRIAGITGFPQRPGLYERLGLPTVLPVRP
jgi:RNA polymerase sigma-70 factor (ECF subfamily)